MKKALVFSVLMLVSSLVPAFATNQKVFRVEPEFSPVWQTRNDTRIPNSARTEFANFGPPHRLEYVSVFMNQFT